jgi:hypothetical protein
VRAIVSSSCEDEEERCMSLLTNTATVGGRTSPSPRSLNSTKDLVERKISIAVLLVQIYKAGLVSQRGTNGHYLTFALTK